MSDILLVGLYRPKSQVTNLRHHRGQSFVTSDMQMVNYTNIPSEGTDSR